MRVGIAGAGIGGLFAGICLRRLLPKCSVTVFDHFASPRPVGAGLILQPVGMTVLAAIGGVAMPPGATITRLLGATESGKVVLNVDYKKLRAGDYRYGLGVARGDLFSHLLKHAEDAGVDLRCNEHVMGLSGDGSITFSSGNTRSFDLVIDARGSMTQTGHDTSLLKFGAIHCVLPMHHSVVPDALSQRYRGCRRMAGVLPLGGQRCAFFWSVNAEKDGAAGVFDNLPLWKSEVCTLWPEVEPLLASIVSRDQLVLARYLHRTVRQWSTTAGRRVMIGDCFHSTSPQLGQGANFALLDAFTLANCVAHSSSIEAATQSFVATRRNHVSLYQMLSKVFTPFYQSESKSLAFVRDHLAGPISQTPPFDRFLSLLVSGMLMDPVKR